MRELLQMLEKQQSEFEYHHLQQYMQDQKAQRYQDSNDSEAECSDGQPGAFTSPPG
jgi:hypothetical protein